MSVQRILQTTGTEGLTNGEPLLIPEYGRASNGDAFSIELPDGRLISIETDSDQPDGYNVFLLGADEHHLIEKRLI